MLLACEKLGTGLAALRRRVSGRAERCSNGPCSCVGQGSCAPQPRRQAMHWLSVCLARRHADKHRNAVRVVATGCASRNMAAARPV